MIIKKPVNRNLLVLVALSATLIVLGLVAYSNSTYLNKNPSPTSRKDIDYNSPSKDQASAGSSIKERALNSGTSGSDQPLPPKNQEGDKDVVSVAISSTNSNGTLLQIRTLIGAVVASGTCTVTLSKDSALITKQSDTQPLANSSTCEGFDIPLSDLSSGKWNVRLDFENPSLVGSSNQTVEIK